MELEKEEGYWNNGQLWYRYYLDKNNLFQGLFEFYKTDGTVYCKGYRKDGKKVGEWIEDGKKIDYGGETPIVDLNTDGEFKTFKTLKEGLIELSYEPNVTVLNLIELTKKSIVKVNNNTYAIDENGLLDF